MCNYSGRLIAWLDGELPETEAVNVAWHVRQCRECRRAADSYQEISGAFLDCYSAAMPVRRLPGYEPPRYVKWIAAAAGIAAAILVAAVLFARPRPQALPAPQVAAAHPPNFAFEKTPPRIVAARVNHMRAPQPVRRQWVAVEPTVEIALPADALFPPGAVPPGFSYIADIRPQP
jgi:Putative zinc-finger